AHQCSHRPLRQGSRSRAAPATRRCPRARPAPLLPPDRRRARAAGPDGGRRADHPRVEQLPRAHPRPAGQGGRPGGARRLRHRADGLALHERDHSAARRARAGDRGVDGNRRCPRLHHRLSGQRRRARGAARADRHGDRRLRGPCLDPRRHCDVARQGAALPSQPPRQARADAGARGRGRRRRARRGGRSVLDGGRRRRPTADRRAVPRPRGAPDGRRSPRRRCARRPRCGRVRALRDRGRGRPAHGHVLEVDRQLRRVHRRHGRGDRLPADPVPVVHVHRRGRPRGHRGGPGGDQGHPLARRPGAADPTARQRRLPGARADRAGLPGGGGRRRAGRLAGRDPDRASRRRRRLAGRGALEGALRRRRLHQRRPLSGGSARRSTAAHERYGHPRAPASRPSAGRVRPRSGVNSSNL
ncbi:MAG: 8-amino-7-oxononanoate synthase, partial [uncultured Solirubrobacterales bacterium]